MALTCESEVGAGGAACDEGDDELVCRSILCRYSFDWWT